MAIVSNKSLDQELVETSWPLTAKERDWNGRSLFVVLMVAAAATWCYVIGEYVGYYLPLWPGFFAMIAGAMIGMLLVTLAVVPTSTRFGVDSIKAAVPQFGTNGWTITVSLQYLSIIGWNALLLIFFGKSISQFLNVLGIGDENLAGVAVPAATIVACVGVFFVLMRGVTGLERVAFWLFISIVAVGTWLIIMLVVRQGDTLASALPAYASDKQLDFQYGIEIALVSLLSWWPYIGSMTRMARNPSVASGPSMLGMGLPVPILSFVGLASILALGISDPTAWLTEVGGQVSGAVALLFIITANLGTALAGLYAATVGIKAVPAFEKLSWNKALLVSILPVALIGLFIPNWVFDNFGTFVAYIGVFFAPVCGIMIVDYFFLRKGKISIRGIYDNSNKGVYRYWGGFNPAAVIAMVVGFFTYTYLLDPISYEINNPFPLVGASLPAAVLSALSYVLVTVLVVKPARKGGY